MEDNENNQVTNSGETTSERTYTEAEFEQMKNQMKEENEKTFDEKFNKRWGKEMRNLKKENAKKDELVDLIKKQTKIENIDDLLNFTYSEYHLDRPKETFSKKDYESLGKIDAKEILDGGDFEDIEQEAGRLSEIEDRNPREQAEFMELQKYLTSKRTEQKRKKELQESGIDEEVLKDEDFIKLVGKFRDDVSIKEIYENYEKIKPKKEKPFTTGSLKSTNVEDKNMVKEFYTFEESKQFTKKDFDNNPALWKAIQDSALKWGKK